MDTLEEVTHVLNTVRAVKQQLYFYSGEWAARAAPPQD
jgi:hypothetical protein